MAELAFHLHHVDNNSKARAGTITTDHGEVLTPIFMPVGTAGTVKAVSQRQLVEDVKAQIILGNTYHLYLRPGMEELEQARRTSPIHALGKPMLTDSGGYQVFSLAKTEKINYEACYFPKSHRRQSPHFCTENVIDIQRAIGADIIMAFDECPPYPSIIFTPGQAWN
jgi:queuine tRNA-ribosyltransferase